MDPFRRNGGNEDYRKVLKLLEHAVEKNIAPDKGYFPYFSMLWYSLEVPC